MNNTISGIIPVMLTPYSNDGTIDYEGYARLTQWYLDNDADALFAVCQSSEMHHLKLEERVALARQTVKLVDGRVPVLASGHIAGSPKQQLIELTAMADTGIDALVLVTNRIPADRDADESAVLDGLRWFMHSLPLGLPLALYECPLPFRRLLSDDVLKFCADSGRFVALKDVSCDLAIIKRRLDIVKGSPLAVINANAAIALPAMQAGSHGFCGVMNNYHPDLYAWLYHHGKHHPAVATELAIFLALGGTSETQGYPAIAKRFHQRLGTFSSIACRNIDVDIYETYWALDALLDNLMEGASMYRDRISKLLRVVK
ncbi:MAG: dihydrodipicolinate synthase family protein [Granulosicoccus sp.]